MKRRKFIIQGSLGIAGTIPVVKKFSNDFENDIPFFTTGIKVGEVTSNSAIVWARLTKDPVRVADRNMLPHALFLDDANGEWHPVDYFKKKYNQDRPDRKVKVSMPEGHQVETLDGAVPGSAGEIRILYKKDGADTWTKTNWKIVAADTDFTMQVQINDLMANASYQLKVEGRKNKKDSSFIEGIFKTAPTATEEHKVSFMVTTCHEYTDQDDAGGFKIFKIMESMQPDFLVHTGDVLYHDHISKTISLGHWNWQRMTSLLNSVAFYKNVPCYFMKDDHDTWMNDSYPASTNKFMGEFTFKQGVEMFRQQVPSSEKPYRTFHRGKDVQIWLFDVREYRVPNELLDGPEKTIWGSEQMNWFKETYRQSDATFKILISPTPIIGPDRPQKKDNHSNSNYLFEGDMIRNFIAGDLNTFVVCGDRHWQYVSKHKKTGTYEFACGPASDEHAGGWKKDEILPEHQYLNVVGGFLKIDVERRNELPVISFGHYSVDGKKLNEKVFNKSI